MKKETGVAISMGIIFGLVFSFVVILNTQKNQTVTQKQQTQKKVVTGAGTGVAIEPLIVSAPTDGVVLDTNKVSLKGTTEKGSFLVVQTQTKDLTATAENGAFTIDVPLSLGENVIHISSYPKGTGGKVQEKELKVYYLTAN